MKTLAVCLSGIICFTLSGTVAFGAGDKSVDAKALFEQKCNVCHSSERAKSKKKTAAEWTTTVMRMKNVNGCPITDDEAKVIINYLTKAYGKGEES